MTPLRTTAAGVENELERSAARPPSSRGAGTARSPHQPVRQLRREGLAAPAGRKASAAGDWEKGRATAIRPPGQIEKDIQAAEQELESVKENALLKEEIGEDDIAASWLSGLAFRWPG